MDGWRRFERGSQTGVDEFWSVRLRGRVCELRYGLVDQPATEEVREYPRESKARSVVKRKIRSRLEGGWVEVEQPDDARTQALERGEALERAIAQDLTRIDNWAVYADFLQGFEPLLGERLGLGLALADADSEDVRARLHAAIEALEHDRARELFGATLAGVLAQRFFGRRMIELERCFGMVVGATIHDRDGDTIKVDALARALLELPLARVLVEFHVHPHVGTAAHMQITEALVSRPRPTLRRLTLGATDVDLVGTPQRLPLPLFATLLDHLPALERLELHGSFRGPATHPSLRALRFVWPVGEPRLDIASWRLPALETLHLLDPGRIEWSQVELPRLERLLFAHRGRGDQLVESLARAPLLRQLRSLVLVSSRLSNAGIATMLEHAEVFARVGEIAVFGAVADRDVVERLQQRLPNVELGAPAWSHERDELTRFWPQR